jgi:hypothetical protein
MEGMLQYIVGGGTGSMSSTFGRWGMVRKRGVGRLTAGVSVTGDLATVLRHDRGSGEWG